MRIKPVGKYLFLFLLLAIAGSSQAHARKPEMPTNAVKGEDRFAKPLQRAPHHEDAFTKLGRGFTNIIEGPCELYTQTALIPPHNDVIYTFFAGLSKGLAMFAVRELVGVYDIVSFPFPLPEDYKPLIQPATTFTDFEWRRSLVRGE